jgi:hypothetical protein
LEGRERERERESSDRWKEKGMRAALFFLYWQNCKIRIVE